MTTDFKSFNASTSYNQVDSFIGRCLMMVTYTHVAHFVTDSYAQHRALGDFYEALQDLIDKFAEVYIGTGGVYRPLLRVDESFDLFKSLRELTAEADYVKDGLDSSLVNIIDEIKALTFQTLYKLEKLK